MAEHSPEREYPIKAFGWAARDSSGRLSPFNFSRRETGKGDVRLKVLYCGICDTDLPIIKNDWTTTVYPVVPGHEIVGEVTEVGNTVEKVKIGDKVGVGSIIGACHSCDNCANDLENYCPKMIFTYNSIDLDGKITYGGFSDHIVVNEHYIIRIPDNMPLDTLPPLFCAGITVYSPLKYFGLGEVGKHVGIIGLGGLGHLGVKFAKAMGAKVTVISTSPSKKIEALEHLGADAFLVSHDPNQLESAAETMDGIIDTVSAVHSLTPYFSLLKLKGRLILLGVPTTPLEFHPYSLYEGRKSIGGSAIGGIKETQEMINFAAKHNITADVEIISMDYVNMAFERVVKSDVKYRFVVDVNNTLAATKPY